MGTLTMQDYDTDDFVSTSLDTDYNDDKVQEIERVICDDDPIQWNQRTFPSWCPMIHFSPIEDGLNMNSIYVAHLFKYQWYGTWIMVIFDFIVTIILVSTKEISLNILGSSFLICSTMTILSTYTFFHLID